MPSTSARLDPIPRTTGEPTTENAVNDVYSKPSDIDPKLPSCVREPRRPAPISHIATPPTVTSERALGNSWDGRMRTVLTVLWRFWAAL